MKNIYIHILCINRSLVFFLKIYTYIYIHTEIDRVEINRQSDRQVGEREKERIKNGRQRIAHIEVRSS